jgi:hypothetical protein
MFRNRIYGLRLRLRTHRTQEHIFVHVTRAVRPHELAERFVPIMLHQNIAITAADIVKLVRAITIRVCRSNRGTHGILQFYAGSCNEMARAFLTNIAGKDLLLRSLAKT